ncbi:hypothetical protein [Geothrix sp. 21YS21S-4]|uniref:hypothetical protein n=1 Tax=Geothrix sp. 21YS21S-4 TaxID=3068889 RepID=UPI0027BA978F|nr:hypothetical protein [Geothrix sp. 21YS21S-4]
MFSARLPEWAAAASQSVLAEKAPEGADAWVLLDRTEIAYVGAGEIRQRRFRVVQVLTERGTNQAAFLLQGLGGKASQVKKLRAWNLRPDGEMVKLDRSDAVTIHDAGSAEFSTDTVTGVALDRVVVGSLLAFESLEAIQNPIGPIAGERILEANPVRRWELAVAKKEGWFTDLKAVGVLMEKHHFRPWIEQVDEVAGQRITLSNLPALPKDEGGHPDLGEILPMVRVRFFDPDLPVSRMWGSWDTLAAWEEETFGGKRAPATAPSRGWAGLTGLRSLHAWMGETFTYRQVYLTPERGWVPERADQVGRKRYGDCKDLTCVLISEAKALGYAGYPVLATIGGPRVAPDTSPFPFFNHVITALKLETSLGLPAEVETPGGRFLLVDPTDFFTPLGLLGTAHRGRQVMICADGVARWVSIPDSAVQPSRLELEVEGSASREGKLTATLRIRETGDAWGLRSMAKARGAKGVHDRLVEDLLDLPPTGAVVVQAVENPLELDKPFEVTVKVDHPQGFRLNGGERELVGWGIPWPPKLIQKVGVPRRYPVQSGAFGEQVLRVRLRVPGAVQPVLPARSGETPFRAFTWEATSEREGAESVVSLRFDIRWKPATYGFEAREEGLGAWKKDRSSYKAFREEALGFKVLP